MHNAIEKCFFTQAREQRIFSVPFGSFLPLYRSVTVAAQEAAQFSKQKQNLCREYHLLSYMI